jgi:hypothetical protein
LYNYQKKDLLAACEILELIYLPSTFVIFMATFQIDQGF